jgi:hypothetical protein
MSRFHLPVMTLHCADQGNICQTHSVQSIVTKFMKSETSILTLKDTYYYTRIWHRLWAGIAQLRAGRFGDRISVGARFSASVKTGPGADPASCTLGTGFLSRE